MSHILLITSSPRRESYSNRVAHSLAEKLAARAPNSRITVRNLARESLPHIDDTFATARNLPPESLTVTQQAALELSDRLLQELFAADTIIIAAGMINFSIPSSLKAYIDYILRPGVTFRYTAKGPEGMVNGKKVFLVLARGGVYTHGPMQQFNFQDPYLRASLALIGLNDMEVITVEGVAFGAEAAAKSVADALDKVSAIAA